MANAGVRVGVELAGALAALFAAACSPPSSPLPSELADDGGGDDATVDDGTDAGPGEDAPSGPHFASDSAAPDPSKLFSCSDDFHGVVDVAAGKTTACAAAEGCAAGVCVSACAAAAANKGTIGCDFVVATPSFYPGQNATCFAVFVANGWEKAAKLTVARAGQNYDATAFGRIPVAGQTEATWPALPATGLPPGQVAVLFLTAGDQPGVPGARGHDVADSGPVDPSGLAATGVGRAWHVVADVPVTAYDMLPYGGASSYLPSAELLLPTTAWGTNYYGIVPPHGSMSSGQSGGPQWGQIVASQDNTSVQVVPTVALPGGAGVVAAPAAQVTKYKLNAGDFVQWQDSGEMSSTVVSSDKPIAFNGGNAYDCYTSLTSTGGGCDSAHQAIPPITALGSDYVAPPFTTRRADLMPESIPYRFVGVVRGTTLKYDPPVTGAPATLGAGEVVDFETTVPFRVKSQDAAHPFYVGQVMPGCNVTGGTRGTESGGCLGDEEFVNILPPAQYLKKYVFFTDATYGTTNLVFVRKKNAGKFEDVTLDCAGKLAGWKAVDVAGDFQMTNVDIQRDGVGNGTCKNGPHSAQSAGPFGLMVWGLDYAASYAYPAGGNVAAINTVVVPPVPTIPQ